jgi:hypothetical protein
VTVLEITGGAKTVIKQVTGYVEQPTPTGLRIDFSVNKALTDQADRATIRIYNLAPESRAALAQRNIHFTLGARRRVVQLSAGYASDERLAALFNGGVEKVTNTKRGPDWITEITGSAALNQMWNNTHDEHWGSRAGTPASTVLNRLADVGKLGMPKLSTEAAGVLNGTKLGSFTASGTAYDSIRRLIRGLGLTFTVDVDGFRVTKGINPTTTDPILAVNELSGMIGTPQVGDVGVDFRTLLDPRLIPGQLVRITSDTLAESTPGLGNLFTTWTVDITGDTHEDEWYMDVNALFYPAVEPKVELVGLSPAIEPEVKAQGRGI